MNKLLLEGKTCIVTGASEGIGYAIAELFVEEGANVVMISRRPELLEQAAEKLNGAGHAGRAVAFAGDVTDESLSRRAFEFAIATFGDVDIMINNVGLGETNTVETTSIEHWDYHMDINLKSVFLFCREAADHFLKKNEGVIINVSSINGVKPGSGVSYCAAKAAVNNMSRNIAIRFAGTNVRVNVLSPGYTETKQSWAPPAQEEGTTSMRQFSHHYVNDSFDGNIPPRAQAYGALYLASEMGQYVTGQNLIIDKGRY